MATSAESLASTDPGRVHTAVALAILGVAGGICLLLLGLAHSRSFEAGMREIRWEEAKRTKNIFLPVGHIADDADRVLNEEIPSVDHRRGGVYFMGTSGILWALRLWDLPEDQRGLIHNVAVVGTGHVGQGLLLRYLVEREGLLDAGPDKTLVLFGAGYQNVGFNTDENSNMSVSLAKRGFYARGPNGSIERSAMGWLERTISIERSRMYGIASGLKQLAQNLIRDRIGRSRSRVQDPREFNRARSFLMGADWRRKIDVELASLMESIDYLKAKGVPVVVIVMPQGSWEDNVPFDRAYNEDLLKLCRARDVKVLDLHELLVVDDFADSTHLAPTGMEKFERAVLPVCLDHLRSVGLLPKGETRPSP